MLHVFFSFGYQDILGDPSKKQKNKKTLHILTDNQQYRWPFWVCVCLSLFKSTKQFDA